MATLIICDGQVYQDAAGAPLCSTGWQVAEYATVQPFDPATLDPALIVGAVAAGFFVLLPVWGAAKGAEFLLRMIRG